MPEAIEARVAEFGKQASFGSWFLAKERDIEEHAALLPYSHYLRQAWSEVNLNGVLCVDGRPTVYICGGTLHGTAEARSPSCSMESRAGSASRVPNAGPGRGSQHSQKARKGSGQRRLF